MTEVVRECQRCGWQQTDGTRGEFVLGCPECSGTARSRVEVDSV